MGIEWTELSDEEKYKLKISYGTENGMWDMIRYPQQKLLSPRAGIKCEEAIKNLPIKEDDIWLVTYPKCGTTWIQETTTMLVNDVDENYAKVPLEVRSPFLDLDAWVGDTDENELYGDEFNTDVEVPELYKEQAGFLKKGNVFMAKNMSGRRVLKTHYSMDFLPDNLQEKCKVIYVGRSPKDCAVSYFHMMVNTSGYTQNFNTFVHEFMSGLVVYGDYWAHLQSAWNIKNHPNVKFIWFEEMKKDSKKVIEELTEFLGHPLSKEKVDALVHHVSFDVMKNNPAANPMALMKEEGKDFMRSGKVGDWKNHFSGEEIEQFDAWIKTNLENTGIKLPE